MVKEKIITIKIGELSPKMGFFSYLSSSDISNIEHDIGIGLTHGVGVYVDGVLIFGSFIENYGDVLHIREVGGKFPKYIKYLEIYCTGLSKYLGIKKLTVCTERKGVAKIAEGLNFKYCDKTKEFYKELN